MSKTKVPFIDTLVDIQHLQYSSDVGNGSKLIRISGRVVGIASFSILFILSGWLLCTYFALVQFFNYTFSFIVFIFLDLVPDSGSLLFPVFSKMWINSNPLMLPFHSGRSPKSQMSFSHVYERSRHCFHLHYLVFLITRPPRSQMSQLSFFKCNTLWFLTTQSPRSQIS